MQTHAQTAKKSVERSPDQFKNGVNLSQLGRTVQAIQSDPRLADFIFKATNRWLSGANSQIKVDEYFGTRQTMRREKPFTLSADEPAVLLGTDKGPNPGEYVLAALSACMTSTLAYHGAAQGYEVESIESSYEGVVDLHGFLGLDKSVRNGYKEVRANFKVKTDADKQKIEELLKLSPVYDIISNPVRIVIQVEKN